jgi:hypothetical protein
MSLLLALSGCPFVYLGSHSCMYLFMYVHSVRSIAAV